MTATLLSFPTLLERDAAEFDRQGTSNYIRAVTEAAALWCALVQRQRRDRAKLARRIAALALLVQHLARYRPECLGDTVALGNGGQIELQLVPNMLRPMLGIVAAND